jgi:hypothetical protein
MSYLLGDTDIVPEMSEIEYRREVLLYVAKRFLYTYHGRAYTIRGLFLSDNTIYDLATLFAIHTDPVSRIVDMGRTLAMQILTMQIHARPAPPL